MDCHRIWILALGGLCAAMTPLLAAGVPPAAGRPGGARPAAPRQLAGAIDQHIAAGWAKNRVKGNDLADDAAFLRRLSLDLTGKIPSVSDARRFLADRSPEKRAELVENLLSSPGYANHFANVWRDLMVPEVNSDFQRRYLAPSFERWLHNQFNDNVPYDRMVRELITLPMQNSQDPAVYQGFYNGDGTSASPLPFYLLKEGKPEELAASVSRVFLGVRIECAQCHDHPFGKWKREEFWGQAAFFASIRRPQGVTGFYVGQFSEAADRREIAIPNTERIAQARFLDGKDPRWKYKTSARVTLADWMTAPDNPFFARALVNRLWAHFFGIGLVDPVDDMHDTHPASHPELLDHLARAFVANKFDLKFLIRAITLSETYQLSSVSGPDQVDVRLFTRMPVKGLTAEQVFDSLSQATGTRDNMTRQQRVFTLGTSRQEFMDKFASQERPTEYQTAIPQVLTLMNNPLIAEACNPDRGRILGSVVASTFMTTEGKVESLYLAVLSRKPTGEELARMSRYVEKGGAGGHPKKALSDVYWALLNSPEFLFNH